MIKLMINMQTLEIREDIYERFLTSKLKHKPHLSNDDFIQFLMTQFENCCSRVLCNGYRNGVTENSNMDPQISETTSIVKDIDSQMKENVALIDYPLKPLINSQLSTCPECKFSSLNRREIEQHFNECHDMMGAFPCTCGQCFTNMSLFLAHYIVCPIAATDLQQSSFSDELYNEDEAYEEGDEEEEEEISVQDAEKDNIVDNLSPCNVKSRGPSSIRTEDSNDQPLDFHIHSPSFSNPLNLVKTEKLTMNKDSPMTDYSINAMNFENNNSSSNEKSHLQENCNNNNNASSLSTSSPGAADQPKKTGKVYECEHCEKIFKSKGLLDQHKHLHFPPRHECEFCGRRFRWPPQFYTHKQQCSKRKLGLIGPESHNGHNIKKHNYGFSPATGTFNQVDSRSQPPNKMFPNLPLSDQCLCGYKSAALTDMYDHKRSCVATARAMILQKLIDYKSIQNPSLLPTMSTVNGTPSVHSVMQNFLSNSTNQSIDSVPLLQNLPPIVTNPISQPNKVPLEEKPFECDFCESRFMTKISLKQHLDGKHSDQAKYCCEKCGKGYFWNASYNYHKKKCTVKPLMAMATGTGLNH